MLVFSRNKNQRIVLSEGGRVLAVIEVVEIRGDKVRIGIVAPAEIGVDREEVFEAKQEQTLAASAPHIKEQSYA